MGFTYDANYTYAVNRADNQGDAPSGFAGEVNYGLPIADRFHVKQDLGNVEGTRRHRMLLSGMYQLPFGRGRAWMNGGGVKDAFLGGWDLTTVTLLETGPWLTPSISGSGRPVKYECSQPRRRVAAGCGVEGLLRWAIQGTVFQPGGFLAYARRRRTLWKCWCRNPSGTWNGSGEPRHREGVPHHREAAWTV